jgi:hypothetical protein
MVTLGTEAETIVVPALAVVVEVLADVVGEPLAASALSYVGAEVEVVLFTIEE